MLGNNHYCKGKLNIFFNFYSFKNSKMGRRKKCCYCVCALPISLCCAYLFCVYSVFKKHTLLEIQYNLNYKGVQIDKHLYQLRDTPKWYEQRKLRVFPFSSSNGTKVLRLRILNMSMEEAYLRGLRTDVDRTEDRKKKKMVEKLRKGLKERCMKNENDSCDELSLLENEIKNGTLTNNSLSIFPNINDKQSVPEPLWNAYADKGLTIVGHNGSLHRRLPHVLIIGAKKGGTRALLEFLRLHPSVTAAGAELHFFDRYYYRGAGWYRSKLPASLEGQLTVEKTPAYFVDKDVPQRVHQYLPSAKLLLVVRDPVIRAISDFAQSLSKHDKNRSFKDLAFKNATSGLVNVAWGPIRGGLYARHFQRWRKYFSMTSIRVISGERLVSNPAKEMIEVQDFLGIERVINDHHFYFNETKGFPCLVKREKNGRPHCLGYSKGRSHPKVDEETMKSLKDFYRPFNTKFYKLVGRNFGWN